jgi:hypothetical protein
MCAATFSGACPSPSAPGFRASSSRRGTTPGPTPTPTGATPRSAAPRPSSTRRIPSAMVPTAFPVSSIPTTRAPSTTSRPTPGSSPSTKTPPTGRCHQLQAHGEGRLRRLPARRRRPSATPPAARRRAPRRADQCRGPGPAQRSHPQRPARRQRPAAPRRPGPSPHHHQRPRDRPAHLLPRATRVEKEYLRLFPSLNASYHLRDNLIARAAYSTSIGRPDFNQYAGGITLPNTEVAARPGNRITVNNAGIKPWTASTVKVRLEYYFEGVGQLSDRRVPPRLQKLLRHHGLPATPEFLGLYGSIPSNTAPTRSPPSTTCPAWCAWRAGRELPPGADLPARLGPRTPGFRQREPAKDQRPAGPARRPSASTRFRAAEPGASA